MKPLSRMTQGEIGAYVQSQLRKKGIEVILAGGAAYEEGRYFRHRDSQFFVEFPPGPLAIGEEPVKEIV